MNDKQIPTSQEQKKQQEQQQEEFKLNSCMVYSSGEINRIYFKDEKTTETTINGKRILKKAPSIENINDLVQILMNEPILELKGNGKSNSNSNSNGEATSVNKLKLSIDSPNNSIDDFDLTKLNLNSIVFIN